MATQKKDWAAIDDDDEERLEPHYKEEKIVRSKEKPNDKSATIEEVVVQKKWVIPVRKQVKDRKKWEKFGEVANIPKGEHKPGDYTLDNPIEIQTSGEQGEIGLIKQLARITTDTVRENRERKKLDDIEQQITQKDKPEPEKTVNKWDKMFVGRPLSSDYSIRVSNIMSYEKELKDTEIELNEFFDDMFVKLKIDCKKKKYLSNRESKRFLGKAFFAFNKQEDATKALEVINGLTYNNCLLEADVAEPSNPNPNPNPYPRKDNRR